MVTEHIKWIDLPRCTPAPKWMLESDQDRAARFGAAERGSGARCCGAFTTNSVDRSTNSFAMGVLWSASSLTNRLRELFQTFLSFSAKCSLSIDAFDLLDLHTQLVQTRWLLGQNRPLVVKLDEGVCPSISDFSASQRNIASSLTSFAHSRRCSSSISLSFDPSSANIVRD